MKTSDLFVACLEEEGVRHVFGVPGEETLDLVESLRTSPIEFVVCRHEQHAAFMAATYGRLTGRAGVCLSTLGPGATNLITGLAHAQLGGMPLVAITGQKPLQDNPQGTFQLLDVVDMMQPVTKWARTITSGGVVPRSVRHAFKLAEGERPGAVHLELPQDVAGAEVPDDLTPQPRTESLRPVPAAGAVARAAEAIAAARRPVVLVSSGANRKRIGRELRAFVEHTGLFAVATQTGKGVLPDDHPQSLFALGIHKLDYAHAALEAADLIVAVGYDIVEYPPKVWNESRHKHVVHVDFRPAEPDAHYAPEVEVVGDVAAALSGLREALPAGTPDAGLVALREELQRLLFEIECETCHPPTQPRVVRDVREVMGPADIVCLDNGLYKLWFARTYRTLRENTLLLDNALATMGAGLGAAMAAKLVHTERRCLAVVGDGGFLMNLQDLETAVRLGQDLVVLVLVDDAYGFIRWKQAGDGLPDFGMTFGNPDFVALALAFGAHGLRVEEGRSVAEVLEQAFAHGGVVLVECPISNARDAELHEDLVEQVRSFSGPTGDAP